MRTRTHAARWASRTSPRSPACPAPRACAARRRARRAGARGCRNASTAWAVACCTTEPAARARVCVRSCARTTHARDTRTHAPTHTHARTCACHPRKSCKLPCTVHSASARARVRARARPRTHEHVRAHARTCASLRARARARACCAAWCACLRVLSVCHVTSLDTVSLDPTGELIYTACEKIEVHDE